LDIAIRNTAHGPPAKLLIPTYHHPVDQQSMHLSIKDKILPQPASFSKKKEYKIHGVLGEGAFGKVMVSPLLLELNANRS